MGRIVELSRGYFFAPAPTREWQAMKWGRAGQSYAKPDWHRLKGQARCDEARGRARARHTLNCVDDSDLDSSTNGDDARGSTRTGQKRSVRRVQYCHESVWEWLLAGAIGPGRPDGGI